MRTALGCRSGQNRPLMAMAAALGDLALSLARVGYWVEGSLLGLIYGDHIGHLALGWAGKSASGPDLSIFLVLWRPVLALLGCA